MIEIEVPLPTGIATNRVPEVIDQTLMELGFSVTLRSTLRQYSGSVHWHIKHGNESGTLELTWWSQRQRLWFKITPRRNAAWIEENVPQIQTAILQRLEKETQLA